MCNFSAQACTIFYVQDWHHLPTISEVFGYKVPSCNRDGALEYLRHIRVYVDGSRLHAADHVISPIRFIARYSLLYQVIKRLEWNRALILRGTGSTIFISNMSYFSKRGMGGCFVCVAEKKSRNNHTHTLTYPHISYLPYQLPYQLPFQITIFWFSYMHTTPVGILYRWAWWTHSILYIHMFLSHMHRLFPGKHDPTGQLYLSESSD